MPTYIFYNKETDETFNKLMSWDARQVYLEENPHLEIRLGATASGDSVRLGIKKPDDGFREVLSKYKKTLSYIGKYVYKKNLQAIHC